MGESHTWKTGPGLVQLVEIDTRRDACAALHPVHKQHACICIWSDTRTRKWMLLNYGNPSGRCDRSKNYFASNVDRLITLLHVFYSTAVCTVPPATSFVIDFIGLTFDSLIFITFAIAIAHNIEVKFETEKNDTLLDVFCGSAGSLLANTGDQNLWNCETKVTS